MALRGTNPESYVTENTLVYEDNQENEEGVPRVSCVPFQPCTEPAVEGSGLRVEG